MKRCPNANSCLGLKNVISGRACHMSLKNCPQHRFESTMHSLTKRNLMQGPVAANKLAFVNKIIDLESKLEDIQRTNNFGYTDCFGNKDEEYTNIQKDSLSK